MCAFDVIGKREECVRAQGYIGQLVQPCALFFSRKDSRLYLETGLPYALGQHIFVFITHVNIDGIVSVCASKAVYKLQSKHLGRLTQPPVIRFLSCQSRAVDTGLLTCTNTDRLSAFYIANRIGLGIFQGDQRDLHIDQRLFGHFFVLCYKV